MVVGILAASAVQATVIDNDRCLHGLWADGAVDSGKGVSLYLSVTSDGKVSKDASIDIRPAYIEERTWTGKDRVVGDSIFIQTRSSSGSDAGDFAEKYGDFILPQNSLLEQSRSNKKDDKQDNKYYKTALLPDKDYDGNTDKDTILNLSGGWCSWDNKQGRWKADISAEDVMLNVVGQFSNSDGKRTSFSRRNIGRQFSRTSGLNAGLDNEETLKVVLKSCGGNYGLDKSSHFAGRCFSNGDRWHQNGGRHDGHHCGPPPVPEPSTLAIFTIAGLCFTVRKNCLTTRCS